MPAAASMVEFEAGDSAYLVRGARLRRGGGSAAIFSISRGMAARPSRL